MSSCSQIIVANGRPLAVMVTIHHRFTGPGRAALKPIAGRMASYIFAFGFIGAGMLAIPSSRDPVRLGCLECWTTHGLFEIHTQGAILLHPLVWAWRGMTFSLLSSTRSRSLSSLR